MHEDEGLSNRIKQELEKVVADNWLVDGPFIRTVDEVASEVRSEFGMPPDFLNLLVMCIGEGVMKILTRKDEEELLRLVIRMYLSGLLQGAKWQRRKETNGNTT